MLMSDLIAKTILDLIHESSDGMAEIRRNTLADSVGCAPSQINYVISSRFTPEQGYIVESKRGGGGYIRITEMRGGSAAPLMHVINSVGDTLDAGTARVLIRNLLHRELLDVDSARLMDAATSDNCYRELPVAYRDRLRSAVFKQMLMTRI